MSTKQLMLNYKPIKHPNDSHHSRKICIIEMLCAALQPYTHLKTLRRFNEDQDCNRDIKSLFTRYANIPTNCTWGIVRKDERLHVYYRPRTDVYSEQDYTDINGKVHTLRWYNSINAHCMDMSFRCPSDAPSDLIAACKEYVAENPYTPNIEPCSDYKLIEWVESCFNGTQLKYAVCRTLDAIKLELINTEYNNAVD